MEDTKPYMDALEYRIKQALSAIVKEAFPNNFIPDFTLEVQHSVRKVHGDYKNGKVRIANLDREPRLVIATAIHELAHHVEYVTFGETSHAEQFYRIYHALLTTACQMGILTADMINGRDLDKEDEDSVRLAQEWCGTIHDEADPDKIYKKGYKLIVVPNSYQKRDYLKARGYFYNSRLKTWEKQIKETGAEQEMDILKKEGLKPYLSGILDIAVLAKVIVIGNTYPYRKELAAAGFHITDGADDKKVWVRNVKSSQLAEILDRLEEIIKKDPLTKVKVEY